MVVSDNTHNLTSDFFNSFNEWLAEELAINVNRCREHSGNTFTLNFENLAHSFRFFSIPLDYLLAVLILREEICHLLQSSRNKDFQLRIPCNGMHEELSHTSYMCSVGGQKATHVFHQSLSQLNKRCAL